MDRKRFFLVFMVLTLALGLLCGAPAFAGAEEKEAEAEAAEDPFEGLVRLGEQTETCAMVKLTNMSESGNIMMINLKRSDDWQWSENLLPDGDTLGANESAVLCYEPAAPEEEEPEDEEEEQGPVTYDLQVFFEDRSGGVCHNIALDDVKDARIMWAWNDIPYLVYTSVATEEEVDMFDAEQELAAAQAQPDSGAGGASEGCVGSSGLLY